MLAIIGLGNPGEKYRHSRHNAGFDVLDILSARLDTPIKKLKFQAVYGETLIGREKVALIKPQTFMNLSGLCVAEASAPREARALTTGCATSCSAPARGIFPGCASAWAHRRPSGTWPTGCWAPSQTTSSAKSPLTLT